MQQGIEQGSLQEESRSVRDGYSIRVVKDYATLSIQLEFQSDGRVIFIPINLGLHLSMQTRLLTSRPVLNEHSSVPLVVNAFYAANRVEEDVGC